MSEVDINYPDYKTDKEITLERLQRYFDEHGFDPKPKFPWGPVILLAAVAGYILYHAITL
jgi:hypothetical protein